MFGVSLLVFAMLQVLPGDPVEVMLGDAQGNPDQVSRLRTALGLDDPLPIQFGRFVWNAAHGDLGNSIRSQRPVVREIADNLPSTYQLACAGLLVGALIGIPLGILAAVGRRSLFALTSMLLAVVGVSAPSFWLGLLLILLLSLRLPLFPATGGGDFQHLVSPALTLGLGSSTIPARLTRSSVIDALDQDYVRTARSKGLRERVVVIDHALKNALIPILTIFGLQFGHLLAGAVIVRLSLLVPAWDACWLTPFTTKMCRWCKASCSSSH